MASQNRGVNTRVGVRVHWCDVLVGVMVWAGFIVQVMVLSIALPLTVADCQSTEIFGCTDVRGIWWDLASIPFWYTLWALSLHWLGSRWAWIAPLVLTTSACLLGNQLPFYRLGAQFAVLGPFLVLLGLSAAWSVGMGAHHESRD